VDFKSAWELYLKISESFDQYKRDVGNARLWNARMVSAKKNPLNLLILKSDLGEFYKAGEDFVKTWIELDDKRGKDARVYVPACLAALTCFVKFLAWDEGTRFKGLDDSMRDIYHNRNLGFKTAWTRVLRGMVLWVRLVYPDEGTWNKYLETVNTKEKVNWADILHKLEAAEKEVVVERAAETKRQAESDRLKAVKPVSVSARTKKGRGMFGKFVKSELGEPHALARMRGLLGAI
jgi:hypothetical protein